MSSEQVKKSGGFLSGRIIADYYVWIIKFPYNSIVEYYLDGEKNEETANAYQHFSIILINLGDYTRANVYYQKALFSQFDNYRFYFCMATKYMNVASDTLKNSDAANRL